MALFFCALFLLVVCVTSHPYNTMVRVGRSYNPQSAGIILSPYNRYFVSQYERNLPQKRAALDADWEIYPIYRDEGLTDYFDY